MIVAPQSELRQLRHLTTRNLTVLLIMVTGGLSLSEELRHPCIDDATAIRQELLLREWELDR